MTVMELGNKLKSMYETKGAKKSAMIHLFAILYADEMQRADIKPIDVLRAAKLPESYVTEINKGINLSKYVALKPSFEGKF